MNIERVKESNLGAIDFDNLEFGKVFTDHMLICDFDGESWGDFFIEPLKPIPMHPASSVLHYGQAIFEGLKAYRSKNDNVNIFRLQSNIARFNESAKRLQMPQLDAKATLNAIREFVALEKEFVPTQEQGSLYIRPFMIGTDHTLKAVSSKSFRFMVLACPVGFYYDQPLSIWVEQVHRRAARGGVGYAKAAGNYAASFYPTELAKKRGFDQILWTDITKDCTLEELGSANFFYVKNGVIHTPEIHDSILKGITRDTVIQLAKDKGLEVIEGRTPAEDFKTELAAGHIDCMFATGTAAAITYVNNITIGDSTFNVLSNSYQPILSLKKDLDDVKFLENDSYDQWNVVL